MITLNFVSFAFIQLPMKKSNLDLNGLKSSGVFQEPIAINDLPSSLNNWTWAASQAWCSGSGTELDPYLIENLNIDGNSTDSCIFISNSEVYFTVQGCNLNNSKGSGGGIQLNNVTNGNINGNDFYNHVNAAIYGIASDYIKVSDNTLNNHTHGIYLAGSYNEILDNTVYGTGTGSGIVIQGSYYNNTITGNTIENCWQGMFLFGTVNNTISDNTVLKNIQYGIALSSNANNNLLSGNIAINNSLSGIIIENSALNTIEGTVAEDNNAHGLYLINSDNNVFYENNIRDNVFDGISLGTGSSGNLFYRNFFWGNGRHVFDDGAGNDWNSTTTGNYWDNHTGPDTSPNDGIVDIPYTFIEGGAGSIDYLPIAEDGPPSIIINFPSEDDVFGANAPIFSVNISDTFLDDMWYTLDGGLHNFTFTGSTGTINQSTWDALPDGIITLTFYASDYADNINSAEVTIEKDSFVPPDDNPVVIIIIVISIVAGVAVVTVVLLLRRRKAGTKV